MIIKETKERKIVNQTYKWSIEAVNEGTVEEIKNWDKGSPFHNSKFRDLNTGKEWLIYQPDQAWPGEVRFVSSSIVAR